MMNNSSKRILGEKPEVHKYRGYICEGVPAEHTRVDDRLAVQFVSSLQVRL